MHLKRSKDIVPSDITPLEVYERRREFMKLAAAGSILGVAGLLAPRALKAQLLTLWFCRFHPDTPLAAKLLAGFVVAYAFSPIDLMPDFIPVLGYLDDLVIVPIGIYLTLRLILPHVLADARMRADEWIAAQKSRPRSNVAAAIIVALWIVILYWLWILVAEL